MLFHKNILICIVSVLLLIGFVSGCIYTSFTTSWIYNYQLSKYETSKIFHPKINDPLSIESLQLITIEIKKYFINGENLDPKITTNEKKEIPVFNTRELIHMKDVHAIVMGVKNTSIISFFMLFSIFLYFIIRKRLKGLLYILKILEKSSLFGIIFIIMTGIIILLFFEKLFLLFHQISFANNYWQLNPEKDFLIVLFPFDFWVNATISIVLASIILILLSFGISFSFRKIIEKSYNGKFI